MLVLQSSIQSKSKDTPPQHFIGAAHVCSNSSLAKLDILCGVGGAKLSQLNTVPALRELEKHREGRRSSRHTTLPLYTVIRAVQGPCGEL